MRRVVQVEVRSGYRLWLTFDDGVTGEVDLSALVGDGVFSAWSDLQAFETVTIGTSGELLWSDPIDLCPDALYLRVTGIQPEDLFPALRALPARA